MTSSTNVRGTELAGLRAIVADEAKPLMERNAAAALTVQLTVDGVPEPADDDAEVVELQKPWDKPGPLSDLIAAATNNLSRTGYPLAEARAKVFQRHKLRAVLALVVSDTAHRLTRLAACQTALDEFLHPNGHHRRNAYTAEKLLAAVKPADGHRWTSTGKVSVVRPPRDAGDVW